VVSWNAMISGCSLVGLSEEAVTLFHEMCWEGVRTNESTFPCVLTSIANAGVWQKRPCVSHQAR
jgi:pentatricopeptide repeat protein